MASLRLAPPVTTTDRSVAPDTVVPGAVRRALRQTPVAGLAALAIALPTADPAAAQEAPAPVGIEALDFRTIGPATMSGRIVDLAVDEANPAHFLMATSTGGLWKTTTGGMTIEPIFEDMPTHSIGDVAMHQADPNLIWLGMGERASRQSSSWGDGVWKSTDGGETWAHMGLEDSKHIGRVRIHPRNPDIVFVAAMGHLWGPNDERGLYRTEDGGATWERVIRVDEDTGAVDVIFDPMDPSILYAATYQRRRRPYAFHGGGPGSALWKSMDGGSSWQKLTNNGLDNGLPEGDIGRIGIDIYRGDSNIVYVSVEQGERYNASTAYEQRYAGIYRSEDRGESWEFMSDWNPRPMYASQITVDPNDDQRIYMVNAYSFSDDGGRTFTVPRQSLHGDDRLVWVNPANSNHVMKADDGGLGISWDRGLTWMYMTHLPVSQFYRIGLDNSVPFRVCGGLQDNGSWCGPSATYRSEGILNEDWFKVGGGDGFRNVFDPDNRTLYTESQYLGLSRLDLVTGERTSIRPGAPEGFIGPRRNWTTWPDLSDPEQRLGNAMPPGNWDGPFFLSPHDPNTIYAGLDELYVSHDRGDNWTSLGNLTSGVDRRTLRTMGELSDSMTLSLDDGIPYYPTLTELAESPLVQGILYAGTDDGQVQVSTDGGLTWTQVNDRLPGLPGDTWISGIEPSRFVEGRVYLTSNNYRNDDYANYVYVSEDVGQTWRRIDGGLPEGTVARPLREDPRNPDVLYLGTEFGLYVSLDRGTTWTEMQGLPRLPVNDLHIHARDNDLVLGTHGRGIWILDDVNAIQQLGAIDRANPYLFVPEPAVQIRYRSERGHTGDMIYEGENPPAGAILDYWLPEGESTDDLSLRIMDGQNAHVATVPIPSRGVEAGRVNRIVWNLRMGLEEGGAPNGPPVMPGTYTVRLQIDGGFGWQQQLVVHPDPRLEVDPAVRRMWTQELLERYRLVGEVTAFAGEVRDAVEALEEEDASARAAKLRDLGREANELRSRAFRLRGLEGEIRMPTGDEASLRTFVQEMLETLRTEFQAAR